LTYSPSLGCVTCETTRSNTAWLTRAAAPPLRAEGRTSALATHDGFFLKPLLPDARGACELALYEVCSARARDGLLAAT
jgi:hypothetical protein